ncbi:hypothetical protein SMALB_2000 [Streptomyces malaysiensis]|uniref:Uncharacterized protein n=1 Tax=Streptomyces malaysiensis TaxID=92644 RepID=A0A7X5WZX5_STRMQ|nr:hypothetical protein [Streptomyces malaysiensis]
MWSPTTAVPHPGRPVSSRHTTPAPISAVSPSSTPGRGGQSSLEEKFEPVASGRGIAPSTSRALTPTPTSPICPPMPRRWRPAWRHRRRTPAAAQRPARPRTAPDAHLCDGQLSTARTDTHGQSTVLNSKRLGSIPPRHTIRWPSHSKVRVAS